MRRVEDLHTALLSRKTSERKAALKTLSSWLENRDFLMKLDELTHSLPQLAELAPSQESWPALCHSLCKCIHLELAASLTGKFAIASGQAETETLKRSFSLTPSPSEKEHSAQSGAAVYVLSLFKAAYFVQ